MLATLAAMAFHAIVEILDALAQVLCTHPIGLVLVASKARVAACVVVDVASCARCIVVAFQQEEFAVIEGRGLPAFCAVALAAILICSAVNIGVGRHVACLAFRAHRRQRFCAW